MEGVVYEGKKCPVGCGGQLAGKQISDKDGELDLLLTRVAGLSDSVSGIFEALAYQDERQIMEQTRYKSVKTVRTYIRKGTLFRDNVAGSLGF